MVRDPRGRPNKSPAFWSSGCHVRSRFCSFLRSLERLYGVTLPLPKVPTENEDDALSFFKKFCSGLLENRSHLWDVCLRNSRLGLRARKSIAMSLFLFRKVIPSPPPSLSAFTKKLAVPSPPMDVKFLEFCERRISSMFPIGWDRDYSTRCLSSTLPTTSCYEYSRDDGGCRLFFAEQKSLDWEVTRHDFVLSVLSSQKSFVSGEPSRVIRLLTGGKWRVLCTPPGEFNMLRPLQETFYNHLSRKGWLLRGDAKPSRFQGFERKEGELFVSGDYESATDNLNSNVQKELLRLVLQRTRHVPAGVVASAMASLTGKLDRSPRGEPLRRISEQRSGQMMGNLLSFPLLCLVNYLTFDYATMDPSIPVRINGDDIVFRARPEVIERWKQTVKMSGLVLSEGKTLVGPSFFSLNSLLFQARKKGGVTLVPVIRSKSVFHDRKFYEDGSPDSQSELGGLCSRYLTAFPGFFGAQRDQLRAWWLKSNSGYVNRTCRSLRRGLLFPVKPSVLSIAGLLERERRYFELDREKDLPAPFSEWCRAPAGYQYMRTERKEKKSRQQSEELSRAFIDAAWQDRRLSDDDVKYEEEMRSGCLDLSDRAVRHSSLGLFRKVRLLKQNCWGIPLELRPNGVTASCVSNWLRSKVDITKSVVRKYGCWREPPVGQNFVSGGTYLPSSVTSNVDDDNPASISAV